MRSEDEIYAIIESYEDKLRDHHLMLTEPIVRSALQGIYESVILTLQWVLEDSELGEKYEE